MIPQRWVYVGSMPYRGGGWATYRVCNYNLVPRLTEEMLEPYKDLRTYDDLKTLGEEALAKMICHSPTDCEVSFYDNDKNRMFYIDSQGCFSWHVNDDGTVGTELNNPDAVVASSIAECLARIDMENRIWLALMFKRSECMNSVSADYLELMKELEKEFLSPEESA